MDCPDAVEYLAALSFWALLGLSACIAGEAVVRLIAWWRARR